MRRTTASPSSRSGREVQRNREKHTIDLVFDVGRRAARLRRAHRHRRQSADPGQGDPPRIPPGRRRSAECVAPPRRRGSGCRTSTTSATVTIRHLARREPDKAIVDTTVIEEKSTGELTIGGGYSSDIGALVNPGMREKNLVGTGHGRRLNDILAQRESQINLSVTDPYFLDRNIVAGVDVFRCRSTTRHRRVSRAPHRLHAQGRLRVQRPSAPALVLFAGATRCLQRAAHRQPLCAGRGRNHAALAGQPGTHA